MHLFRTRIIGFLSTLLFLFTITLIQTLHLFFFDEFVANSCVIIILRSFNDICSVCPNWVLILFTAIFRLTFLGFRVLALLTSWLSLRFDILFRFYLLALIMWIIATLLKHFCLISWISRCILAQSWRRIIVFRLSLSLVHFLLLWRLSDCLIIFR